MQTLRDNGMNPIALPRRIEPRARSPTKKAPSVLFSPPQPAEVKQLPLGAPLAPGNDYDCAPNKAVLWRRSHVDNQKLYDVSNPCPFHPHANHMKGRHVPCSSCMV